MACLACACAARSSARAVLSSTGSARDMVWRAVPLSRLSAAAAAGRPLLRRTRELLEAPATLLGAPVPVPLNGAEAAKDVGD